MTETSPDAGAQSGLDAGASATPGQPAAGSQQPNNSQPAAPALREGAQPLIGAQEPVKAPDAPKEGEQPANEPPAFKIPDAFKDKPWASKIKSEEDLYKQIDTLDALKGKKTVVPDFTKATPKEIDEYLAQTRPESPDAYQFADGTEDGIKKPLADSLYKHGITPYQANAVIKDYQDAEKASVLKLYDANDMMKELETSFGADWKQIGGQTDNILKENLSPADAAMLGKLPNQFLGLMYRAANALVKGYGIKESGAHTDAGSGKTQPQNVEALRADLRGQIAALPGKVHSAQEKQVLIDKLNATYSNTGKK